MGVATDDTSTVQQATTSNWWEKRKDFMGIMVAAAMAKLQGGDLNPVALAKALYEMLDGRHLQMAIDDPDARGSPSGTTVGWRLAVDTAAVTS